MFAPANDAFSYPPSLRISNSRRFARKKKDEWRNQAVGVSPAAPKKRTKDDDEEDWDMTLTTGLHPQIEEKALQPGNTPTSSISETGWKPILHCAVASSRWVREGASVALESSLDPPKSQCSIGSQPVFVRTNERCFQISAVSPSCV